MKKFILLLIIALISACNSPSSSPVTTTVDENGNIGYTLDNSSIDYYGNNVFNFHNSTIYKQLGIVLAAFIALHPELELVTICDYDRSSITLGYYAVFRGELVDATGFKDARDSNYSLDLSTVQIYGNNVYYFNEKDFGSAIATFISLHPELELTSITGTDSETLGTTGFYVTFRNKTMEIEK